MNQQPTEEAGRGGQPRVSAAPPSDGVAHRVFFFGVGGVLSYSLNVAIFDLLTGGLHWPKVIASAMRVDARITGGADFSIPAAYAISLGTITLLAFLWNFHVNFRTPDAWHKCARRYVGSVAFCAAANYAVVQVLLALFPGREKIMILLGMGASAIFKFMLYHLWVFPSGNASEANTSP